MRSHQSKAFTPASQARPVDPRRSTNAPDSPFGAVGSYSSRGTRPHPPAIIRGHQRSSEVIRGHQRSSKVIRGATRRHQPAIISGHSGGFRGDQGSMRASVKGEFLVGRRRSQSQSTAISRNQPQSVAINSRPQSVAINRNPLQSTAINRNQPSSRTSKASASSVGAV